jgi:2,6-dihydroxypseudooxynicotine hydrolase
MVDEAASPTGDGPGEDDEAAFATESLRKWTPRFVANGIDPNDLERLEQSIASWADWCPRFSEVGAEHAALGTAAEARGDTESAGEHFRRAAMYYHFGSAVWHVDPDQRRDAHRTAVDLHQRAGPYLDPPARRLEFPVPGAGFDVPGLLRVPERGPDGRPGDSPLVVLLPGSDSIKEELGAYGRSLLDRGLATLAVDGAGQGETQPHRKMGPDYHELISAVVDDLLERGLPGVDTGRLGIYGVSLGGFYAPHVAANDSRFDACVGVSGKFTVGPLSSWATDLHVEQYTWACGVETLLEADEITEAMTLRGDIESLRAPALMMTGAHDVITPPAQTQRIAKRAPNAEFVCYDDGNHVCNNITYKSRPYAADWLRSNLG